MTLDDRIEKDLKDLYNGGDLNGEIKAAKKLQGVIADNLSTRGMPGHFTGNRNADTVLVTLNPGKDAKGAAAELHAEIRKLHIDTSSEIRFIESYKEGKANYWNYRTSKKDPFDVKQAEFFKAWVDSGIIIPKDFPDNKEKYEDATEEVLKNKLQLELIPFCSDKFKMRKKEPFYEYIKTLLDEIFSKKRKYVIFSSAAFETLFKDNKRMKAIGAVVKFDDKQFPLKPLLKNNGEPAKTKFNCTRIWITYNGKEYKAMIAPTFFVQFGGELLCQYGKFCYDEYNK